MNKIHHKLSVYGGLLYVVLFGLGWALIGGFVPPPSAAADANTIAAFYQANPWRIQLGLTIVMLSVAPLVPFMSVVTIQMARIEGRWPVLAVGNAILGSINTMLLLLPTVTWLAASFRTERDPNLILALNDIGWVYMLWPFSTATLQNWLFGWCILSDKRANPIFPRWLGHFNIWVGVSFFAGITLPFFKTGLFAWAGLPFWLPANLYLVWIIVESAALLKAIDMQCEDGASCGISDGG